MDVYEFGDEFGDGSRPYTANTRNSHRMMSESVRLFFVYILIVAAINNTSCLLVEVGG